jgi:hypothetical protein
MECRDIQISCIAARVWQSHPRHADLGKVSRQKFPSTQKYLTGPIRGALHREAFIPDVKSWGWSSELAKATTEPEEGLAT